MGASKEFFQRNKDLAAWWNAISKHSDFEQVIMAVRSEFMDERMGGEAILGAQVFERLLRTISDLNTEPPLARIKSGLIHNIDNPKAEIPDPSSTTTETGTTQLGT